MFKMIKVGDKVKIIARTCGHGLEIGSIQEISKVDREDDYYIVDGRISWSVGDDEIELVKPDK